ncbi:MAG: hypothetical protein NTW94_09155 [Legionellales bacterium]|nr:hypothetical protein [Legionellales bacterium]
MNSTSRILSAMGAKSKVDNSVDGVAEAPLCADADQHQYQMSPSPSMADVLKNCLAPKGTSDNTPLN